ncbi:transcriptional regulator GcvA [Ferrovibrio sp.]|uniref:transcriptional regulator GcvA n=1 Tax=Ferrovibrio sp. TaxID=1917215 RepID=UPI0035B35D71
MNNPLPPLNPLHVFVVAARFENFTRAAEELGVTQAAVSRQIGVLEGYLGLKLFTRKQRQVVLTPVGARYERRLREVFDQISAATEELPVRRGRRRLNLRVYASFAQGWLIPRLGDFRARHPQIDLNISTSTEPVRFDREEVDIAIQFGRIEQRGVEIVPFLYDVILPVCSPRLLTAVPPLRQPRDLGQHTLLYAQHRANDWQAWLRHVGLPKVAIGKRLTFESSSLAYQAAIEGLGIAIAQLCLVQPILEAGRLVAPFQMPLWRSHAYQLVFPTQKARYPALIMFRDWVLETARR